MQRKLDFQIKFSGNPVQEIIRFPQGFPSPHIRHRFFSDTASGTGAKYRPMPFLAALS